jgi:hypothetical protein
MKSCEGWVIEVLKWEAYNPRTDAKKPTWFRMENSIAFGKGFFGLDVETRWIWVCILCLQSQELGQPFAWPAAWVEHETGIRIAKQTQAIEIFEKFVRLRVVRTSSSGKSPGTDTLLPVEAAPMMDFISENESLRVSRTDLHATNERTNERTDPKSGKPDARPMPKIAEIWNLYCTDRLGKVRACSASRTKAAQARWKEAPQEEFWIEVVQRVAASSFLRGEKPSKDHPHWKADLDWLLRPDNANKVLEGKYDDPKPGGPPGSPKKKFLSIEEFSGGVVTLAPA